MQNIAENKHGKRWTNAEYNELINAIKNNKISYEDVSKLIEVLVQ